MRDSARAQDQASQVASFLALAEKLSGSGKGAAFYSLVEQRSLPTRLARYLLDAFSSSMGASDGVQSSSEGAAVSAVSDAEMPETGSEAWEAALSLVGPPLALQLLSAFTKGQPVSDALARGIRHGRPGDA